MACQSWRWQPFRTTPPYSAEEKSAGSVECNHTPTEVSPPSPLASVLRNTCAPQAMVSVLQERMSEAPAPSLAQRVCIASASQVYCGVDALDECSRHRRQCQGQARAALTVPVPAWRAERKEENVVEGEIGCQRWVRGILVRWSDTVPSSLRW